MESYCKTIVPGERRAFAWDCSKGLVLSVLTEVSLSFAAVLG